MNSTFCTRWLANSEVISQELFTSEQPKKNKMAFVGILSHMKFLFGLLVILTVSVVYTYTKTVIQLSVGESGGYLTCRSLVSIRNYSPPLRWILLTTWKWWPVFQTEQATIFLHWLRRGSIQWTPSLVKAP